MIGWRESAAMLQKAKEFAPENPRVIFEEAIDWFKFDRERYSGAITLEFKK